MDTFENLKLQRTNKCSFFVSRLLNYFPLLFIEGEYFKNIENSGRNVLIIIIIKAAESARRFRISKKANDLDLLKCEMR